MSQESHNRIQKLYRKKFLEYELKAERKLSQLVSKLSDKLSKEVREYSTSDGTLNENMIGRLEDEIDSLSRWFYEESKDVYDKIIKNSAKLAMDSQDASAIKHMRELREKYSDSPEVKGLIDKALKDANPMLLSQTYGDGLPGAVAQQVWEKRWGDGYTLSDRIWKQGSLIRKNLKAMIQKSVNEGISAVELSRAVEEYMEKPGPKWTTSIKPAVTDGASVKYNALRLARTETNQAYHRAQKVSDKRSELVKGTRWNLSESHPIDWPPSAEFRGYDEICQYRAEEDHHGLGPGVYPPGETPFDHPNGLCYLTSVVLEDEELIDMLEEKYNMEEAG